MGIFGGLGGRRGMSPIQMGILGLLAYRALKGRGAQAGGGVGGLGAGLGGLGGLGGLLGGGAIGGMGGGLQDLLDRFRQSGHDAKAQSWVAKGPNQSLAPQELEQALGEERLQWLMEQTRLPKDQLLAGLSKELPETVDELTPDGRLPNDAELDAQVKVLSQNLQADRGPRSS